MQIGKSATIEVLRAASVLYIVGFWHLLNYVPHPPPYANALTYRMTVIVLGIFVFFSGYLIASRDIPATQTGLWSFYKKRLLRIWPLYALALTLFVIFKLTSIETALLASVGVGMVFHGPPPTLWFGAMLLLFYLVAPALVFSSRAPLLFLSFAAGLFLIAQTCAIDSRLSIYLPAFALGIFTARNREIIDRVPLYAIAIACVGAFYISSFATFPETASASIFIASLVPLFCLLVGERIARDFKAPQIFGLISYAGYAMYLFHRPLYMAMISWIPAAHPQLTTFVLCVPGVPGVIAISYIIQLGYDTLLAKFERPTPHPRDVGAPHQA